MEKVESVFIGCKQFGIHFPASSQTKVENDLVFTDTHTAAAGVLERDMNVSPGKALQLSSLFPTFPFTYSLFTVYKI